jgi:putative component of membrane protein insertase Oxa1/YidC/SpoIIIJ protein YidD
MHTYIHIFQLIISSIITIQCTRGPTRICSDTRIVGDGTSLQYQ